MVRKPTAKLRTTFQYNNVMYAAAGECVAVAQQSTWQDVVTTPIVTTLGMTSSPPSLCALRTSDRHAGLVFLENVPKLDLVA
jgi:hypothetical protein